MNMPFNERQGNDLFENFEPRVKAEGRGRIEDFNPNAEPMRNYHPPTEFYPFADCPVLALDIETHDPGLNAGSGPGCYRDDGKVVGVGFARSPDDAIYYPVAHETSLGRNITNPDRFFDWLREEAKKFTGVLVGANLQYDLDWLRARHGVVFPHARVEDVQWAECLIDENRFTYALDVLATEYLGDSKATETLAARYGKDYIKHMHRVDPGWAGMYCEKDCTLVLEIREKQKIAIEHQQLQDVWDLECRGAHILLEMRARGVRVDTDKAQEAHDKLLDDAKEAKDRLKNLVGYRVDPWAADSVARALKDQGIDVPQTAQGRPSVRKDWLAAQKGEVAEAIIAIRGMEKVAGTFIKSYILDGHIGGRLHTQFHPLRGDENGTVSGRYSSSNPNLQNIPARHPVYGPLMRSTFIPEIDMDWGSADWSQIEYRLLAHVCHSVPSVDAEELIRRYRSDPTTDFHDMAAEIAGTDRKTAKNINFGVVYGMGVGAMAHYLGVSVDEAEKILNEFHERAPYLRSVYDWAGRRADSRGYVRTLAGRRRRFPDWSVGRGKGAKFFRTYDEALDFANSSAMGVPKRAGTHKSLNAILQGSAADLMKKAMVDMWEAGLFNTLVPHLTVHDEMNVSVPRTTEGREAFDEMKNMMENAWELAVPVLVDANLGATWDEAK